MDVALAQCKHSTVLLCISEAHLNEFAFREVKILLLLEQSREVDSISLVGASLFAKLSASHAVLHSFKEVLVLWNTLS